MDGPTDKADHYRTLAYQKTLKITASQPYDTTEVWEVKHFLKVIVNFYNFTYEGFLSFVHINFAVTCNEL